MKAVKTFVIVTLVLLVLTSSFSIYIIRKLEGLTVDVIADNQVMRNGTAVNVSFLETESNVRAYLLTNDRRFLDQYSLSLKELNANLDSLSKITTGVPEQQVNFNLLKKKIDQRVASFESATAYYQINGTLSEYVDASKIERAATDAKILQQHVENIIRYEQAEYYSRSNGLLGNLTSLLITVLVIGVVGLITASISLFNIRRNIQMQQTAAAMEKAHREELEERIRQLNFSNQELEQFSYVASHDLQEPLRKITSFIDLYLNQYGASIDAEGKLYLEKIAYSARRMRNLINDLLSFSRAGRQVKDPDLVDLNHVLKAVINDLEVSIKEKGATINAVNLPKAMGTETEFIQVFGNLLSNALKFTKDDRRPEINIIIRSATALDLKAVHESNSQLNYNTVVIEDNGIGFQMEYAKKIFAIFQRLHGRTAYDGTGIGLAICKRILEKYGGGIYATSDDGSGAKFHLILPSTS